MLCIKEWCLDDGFEEIVMKKPPVICSEKGYEEPRKNMTKMFIFIVQTAKTCFTEWQPHICYNKIASAERPYFPNNHQPSKEQYGHRVPSSFHQPMC